MGRRSINTTKSGKYMNPTDQARKEARKKELKKNKKQRMMVRQAVLKGKDPVKLLEEMENIDKMEYDFTNPPKLNEKVLKDKRKKLKETFERVLHLYEREEPEYYLVLKKEEIEYNMRRDKMVTLYEQIKFTENVELSAIPMPDMPQDTPTAQIPLPSDIPLPGGASLELQPKGILKKMSAYDASQAAAMKYRHKPVGPPPGTPPELSDSEAEDEEETAVTLAATAEILRQQPYYVQAAMQLPQPPVPGMDFEARLQLADSLDMPAKTRKIRFSEDPSLRGNYVEEAASKRIRFSAEMTNKIEERELSKEDYLKKFMTPKPAPTPLQLKLLKLAGQQLPKPAPGLGDDDDEDDDDEKAKGQHDMEEGEIDEKRDNRLPSQRIPPGPPPGLPPGPPPGLPTRNPIGLPPGATMSMSGLPPGPPPGIPPASAAISAITGTLSSTGIPPGPPPGVPPMMFRPPLPRPGVNGPPRLIPPGPPPGRPPGIPPGPPPGVPPRGPVPRLPPGPPGMPPPRMLRPVQPGMIPLPGMPPPNSSGQLHAMNPNVLSAPPSIMKPPKADDLKKSMATISAKPQIKHQIGDVTKFMPTSLRVKRDTSKTKTSKTGKKEEVTSVVIRTAPQVASQTKDDVYDMFMREMEDFL